MHAQRHMGDNMKAFLALTIVVAAGSAQAQLFEPPPFGNPLGLPHQPQLQPVQPLPNILPGGNGWILPPAPARCWNRGQYVVWQ
jgi:hypothetical protein